MLKAKLFTVFVFLKSFICPCYWDGKAHYFPEDRKQYKVIRSGTLPAIVNESSGVSSGNGFLYTINDGGNRAIIYKTSESGELIDSLLVPEARNKDWEDLAADTAGNIPDQPGRYIAEVVDIAYLSGMVTAASVDANSNTFTLLSYGKIYVFRIENGIISFDHPQSCIRFAKSGQAEGLDYKNGGNEFLITNEGRKIFLVKKKGLN